MERVNKYQSEGMNKDNNRKAGRKRRKFRFSLFGSWKRLLTYGLIVIIAFGGLSTFKLFSTKAEPVVEKEAFVEQIKDLSSLVTAEAYVKAVLQKEDNKIFGKYIDKNFPGTKRKVLFIVPGSVTAGIDLTELTEEDIKLNEIEKTLEISLQAASLIQEPVLYLKDIEVFSQEGLFRSEMNLREGFEFASEASELVKKEAKDQGLLEVAERNAENILTNFFKELGYTTTITFDNID